MSGDSVVTLRINNGVNCYNRGLQYQILSISLFSKCLANSHLIKHQVGGRVSEVNVCGFVEYKIYIGHSQGIPLTVFTLSLPFVSRNCVVRVVYGCRLTAWSRYCIFHVNIKKIERPRKCIQSLFTGQFRISITSKNTDFF